MTPEKPTGPRQKKHGNPAWMVKSLLISLRANASFGAMALLCAGGVAVPVVEAAQETSRPLPAPDQEDDSVLFEADFVTRKDQDSPIIAEGSVNAYFGDRFLSSDKVVYDPVTDIVTAVGNVAITDENGQTFFADEVELTGDLADGVASNFSALLADDSRLAGDTVVKRGDSANELNNAVFSSCDVCKDDGRPKVPSWQVKADKVVQDKEDQVIRFNNAVFEVLGVPVFYSPYLQIPDPALERKSGLLTPRVGSSTELGAYAEIPYYLALSSSHDLTLSPKFMGNRGVLLQGEYRQNFGDGELVVQPGVIFNDGEEETGNFDDEGEETFRRVPGTRFHFFGEGYKTLNDLWTARVDVNYVSDRFYLRSYDVQPEGDLRAPRGVYRPDRLTSSAALERRTSSSLLTAETIGFQSLRRPNRDNNDLAGQVLPRINYDLNYDVPQIGGTAHFNTNFLSLLRNEGLNSVRAVVSGGWERVLTSRSGHRFEIFSELRADLYSYTDLDLGNEVCRDPLSLDPDDATDAFCLAQFEGVENSNDRTAARLLPTLGVEWSYPLARQGDAATIIVEPRVQYVAAPEQDYLGDVLNDDSQFLEFDTTSLYDWNKGTGYDLWEDGERLNVGLEAAALFRNGFAIEGSLGQQFRREETAVFDAFGLDAGLGDEQSDVVADVALSWGRNLNFDNRFRFDEGDGSLRRAQSTLSGRYGRFTTAMDYVLVQTGAFDASAPEEEEVTERNEFLFASLNYDINENWRIGGNWREDLEKGQTIQQTVQLRYNDECTSVFLSYRNDQTSSDDFDFDRSLSINIELTGFGQ